MTSARALFAAILGVCLTGCFCSRPIVVSCPCGGCGGNAEQAARPAVPPPSAAAVVPEPAAPPPLRRDDAQTDDFIAFFQTLRQGATVDLTMTGGKKLRGNFSRVDAPERTLRLGNGLLGSRTIQIDDITEMRSQTIRGEVIQWKRRAS